MKPILLSLAILSIFVGSVLLPPAAETSQTKSVASTDTTYTAHLTQKNGNGSGLVTVTPIAGKEGFSARITAEVHHLSPLTHLFLQRAPEVGRSQGEDGIAQRAHGLWPWEQPKSPGYPPVPAFITFPAPSPGPLVEITTDSRGEGKVDFAFDAPSIPHGTRFDVVFRLVDALDSAKVELISNCVTVKVP